MMIENVLKQLHTPDVKMEFFENIGSTNSYLKERALLGADDKTVVIANSQSAGKGTKGRAFISDKGGVYISLLTRADFSEFEPTLITPLTAVAVSDSITQISGRHPKIKWVNDIYLDSKKVCGILCETVFIPGETIPFVVVGIGVNLSKPKDGFKKEIEDIATYVFEEETEEIKEKFVALLIDNFFKYFSEIKEKTFLEKYRSNSLLLGKKIFLINGDSKTEATAVEIDDSCHLVVGFFDGKQKALCSGDVTIKFE